MAQIETYQIGYVALYLHFHWGPQEHVYSEKTT